MKSQGSASDSSAAIAKWPALNAVAKPIDWLHADPRNARTHSDEQIEQLAEAIEEFGWTNPIIATPDGTIRAGHGRWYAAKRLGYTEVPVAIAEHWTAEQAMAYGLADNRLAEIAGWNDELLMAQLSELHDAGYSLNLVGFTDGDLRKMLGAAGAGRNDPEHVPEPPAEPVSRPGDLWLLGGDVQCPKCGRRTPIEKAAVARAEEGVGCA